MGASSVINTICFPNMSRQSRIFPRSYHNFFNFVITTRIKRAWALCNVLLGRPTKARINRTKHKRPTPVACGRPQQIFPAPPDVNRRSVGASMCLCLIPISLVVLQGGKATIRPFSESLPKSSTKILYGQHRGHKIIYCGVFSVIIKSKQHTKCTLYVL